MTVDCKAVRMWSVCRQMRAFHISEDFIFVKLDYLEYMDAFLLFYYQPSTKKMNAELWSSLLDKNQKVKCICIITCYIVFLNGIYIM